MRRLGLVLLLVSCKSASLAPPETVPPFDALPLLVSPAPRSERKPPAPPVEIEREVEPHAPSSACLEVVIPAMDHIILVDSERMTRAMRPVIRAVCACTEPGSETSVQSELRPADGTVTAHAPDAPAIDRCLGKALDGRYEPFEVPGDCVDGGPREIPLFHPPSPPAHGRSVISYPMRFLHAAD